MSDWNDLNFDNYSSPLGEAITRKDQAEVKRLIARGTRLSEQDLVGRTPLVIASQNGNCEAVSLLLDAGVHPDEPELNRGIHMTPLMHAVSTGQHEVANLLLDRGADVNAKGIYTPLHMAVIRNDISSVSMLLNRGADPLNAISVGPFAGRSAVEEAAENGLTEILSLLSVNLRLRPANTATNSESTNG